MHPAWQTAQRLLPHSAIRIIKQGILSVGADLGVVPCGAHFVFDLKRRLPNERIKLIFDIGANRGQTIEQYRTELPGARILAFEPDPNTFVELQQHADQDVSLYNLGLSDRSGQLRFDNTHPQSEVHRIAPDQNDTSLPLVYITTLDDFCASQQIAQINLLKIDTEGNDLKVLRGARSMLAKRQIDVVICECSMATNGHVLEPFTNLYEKMASLGYHFFGLYNQTPYPQGFEIEYANCAYVSPIVAARSLPSP